MEHQTIEIAEGVEPVRLPPDMLPVAPLLARLARMDRQRLSDFIQTGIELLDLFDGDPDEEENDLEDSFALSPQASEYPTGPGCEISDAGGEVANEDQPSVFRALGIWNGPGCPIADPDEGADDEGEQTRDEDDWFQHPHDGPGCPIADPGGTIGIDC